MNPPAWDNNAASPHEPNSTIAINLDGLKSKVVGKKEERRVSRLIGSAPLVASPTGRRRWWKVGQRQGRPQPNDIAIRYTFSGLEDWLARKKYVRF